MSALQVELSPLPTVLPGIQEAGSGRATLRSTLLPKARLAFGGAVAAIATSEDEKLFAAGGLPKRVNVYYMASTSTACSFEASSAVTALVFAGPYLVAGTSTGALHLYDTWTKEELGASLPRTSIREDDFSQVGAINALACDGSADEGYVVVVGGEAADVDVYRLDVAEGAEASLEKALRFRHTATRAVSSLSLSCHGRMLALGGEAKVVQLWRLPELMLPDTGRHAGSISPLGGRISPSGDLSSRSGQSERSTARLDATLLKPLLQTEFSCETVIHSLAIARDSQTMAVCTVDGTEIYNIKSITTSKYTGEGAALLEGDAVLAHSSSRAGSSDQGTPAEKEGSLYKAQIPGMFPSLLTRNKSSMASRFSRSSSAESDAAQAGTSSCRRSPSVFSNSGTLNGRAFDEGIKRLRSLANVRHEA